MNYIKEINGFYDWLETNSISEHGIVLWHALMHINNKAGWIKEFAVAISVLEIKTGLKRKAIERARNELQQKGRIIFKTRKGNQSAVYTIVGLIDPQVGVQTGAQTDPQIGVQVVPINKLNKTKLNKEKEEDIFPQTVKLFEQSGMGTINAYIGQVLMDIAKEYPLDLIEAAFKKTRNNKAVSIRYVEKILLSWREKGITCMEQLRLYEENKKGVGDNGYRNNTKEKVSKDDAGFDLSKFEYKDHGIKRDYSNLL